MIWYHLKATRVWVQCVSQRPNVCLSWDTKMFEYWTERGEKNATLLKREILKSEPRVMPSKKWVYKYFISGQKSDISLIHRSNLWLPFVSAIQLAQTNRHQTSSIPSRSPYIASALIMSTKINKNISIYVCATSFDWPQSSRIPLRSQHKQHISAWLDDLQIVRLHLFLLMSYLEWNIMHQPYTVAACASYPADAH